MSLFLALALAATPASEPRPLTDQELDRIGCLATIAIVADSQRRGVDESGWPDVTREGKRWSGLVGSEITEASGQPREIIALAIKVAIEDEQLRTIEMDDPAIEYRPRFDECRADMYAELAADAADKAAASMSTDRPLSLTCAAIMSAAADRNPPLPGVNFSAIAKDYAGEYFLTAYDGAPDKAAQVQDDISAEEQRLFPDPDSIVPGTLLGDC